MKRHKIPVCISALFLVCGGCSNAGDKLGGTNGFCEASTFKSEDELKVLGLKKAWGRDSLFRYGVVEECMNDYDCISKKYGKFPVRVNVSSNIIDCTKRVTHSRYLGQVTKCMEFYVAYNDEDFKRVLVDAGISLTTDQLKIFEAGGTDGFGQYQGLLFDRCGNFLSEL